MSKLRRPSSWTDRQEKSVRLTEWVKSEITTRAHNYLWTRTSHLVDFPLNLGEVMRMTFDSADDYALHKAFTKKFPNQYSARSLYSVRIPFAMATGEKVTFEIDFMGRMMASDRKPEEGFSPAIEPRGYEKFSAWFETTKVPLIETLIGVTLVGRALDCVDTSIQLRELWPGLLEAVKVDMVSRGRSTKEITPTFNVAWIGRVNEWLTEGALRYDKDVKSLRDEIYLRKKDGSQSNVYWKFDGNFCTQEILTNANSCLKLEP